ncbi:hypothetical protein CCO03_17205 [Comamonas serinivorans]|uniref:DUF2059 domain-containing protein n=1 Tax=Comamonas serinivorans TaxID=1082851 RepID=A0A1Y0ERY0_9BURK|nr:DUF2059 domain-containing protein [Comamonas serinivorans]ARU06180.1 hypothetical protein CCO03_17205 [Comamonas serinivorans]
MLTLKSKAALAITAVAFVFPMAAHAQDAKRALAVKLAAIQAKNDGGALTEQLVQSAAVPMIQGWSQRLDESVPPARQKDVRDKLDVELKKFVDSTKKTVEAQVDKTAESTLVPVYMEKFSEEELKTIVAYLESPVSSKFMTVAGDATNAWAKKVVDATKTQVESSAKAFDTAAGKIINAPAPAAPKK